MLIKRTPHNDFFYAVLSRKEQALSFFQTYMPVPLQEVLDWSSLQLYESKHISDTGVSRYNDVLYQCATKKGGDAFLYAVAEHQSTPEKDMPLRLLEYNTATTRDHLKQGHTTYPIFINFVVYHGKEPWVYSTKYSDYYAHKELGAQQLYMAPFTLINLPEKKEEELITDKALGFCFTALHCVQKKDPFQAFAQAMKNPIFKEHFDQLATPLKTCTFSYIAQFINTKKHSLENLVSLSIEDQTEKQIMMESIASVYIQQGVRVDQSVL